MPILAEVSIAPMCELHSAVGNPLMNKQGAAPKDKENQAPPKGMKRKAQSEGSKIFEASTDQSKGHFAPKSILEPRVALGQHHVSDSAFEDLSDSSGDTSAPDLFVHVSKSGLLDVRQKLTQGHHLDREDVHKILQRRRSVTVPLDIRCAGSPFLDLPSPTDLDDVCEKLGAHDMAEGLVKALDYITRDEDEH